MSVVFHCDICGIDTYVNPPSRQAFEEVEEDVFLPVSVIEEINGEKIVKKSTQKQTVKAKKPLTAKHRRQNISTGKVETLEIPKLEYEKRKTVIVQLKVGDETLQKDFCHDCYQKQIKFCAEKLFNVLAEVESK